MARQDERVPHPAVEEFERRSLGTSLTAQERGEPYWPAGTERLYGRSPHYLAPGPEFDQRYRGTGPKNYSARASESWTTSPRHSPGSVRPRQP